MSKDATRVPSVNMGGLEKRTLLQAELMGHDGQLRNFTPLRDRLVASGQDANAMYRQIESRRDRAMAELKTLTPTPVRAPSGTASVRPLRPGGSIQSLPIAPATFFHPPIHGVGFGYAGTVQMGRASEGKTTIPQGRYPTTGSIYTVALDAVGGIEFDGQLSVGPAAGVPVASYDPSLDYFWLHNWTYLIPFPATPIAATFTYSFDVQVSCNVFSMSAYATLSSFVSVGETANYVGQEVTVDTGVGWPLMADLSQPTESYNGSYGSVHGQVTVQRSFFVEGGHAPAVALVLGIVSAQSMGTELNLDFAGVDSGIAPSSPGGPGLVSFHYAPVLELAAAT